MRKRIFLTAAALGASVSVPALAQNADPFTGPRATAILGYDGVRPGSTTIAGQRGDDRSVDGLLYGGDIGYDLALGGVVVGAEGEITGSTGKVENNDGNPNNFGFGRVKAGRDLYLGGRLGYAVQPTTLLYGKVGYTNARFDITGRDGTTETGRHFNLDGYRLGAGVEQSFGRNTYAKLEYRYSNYTSARFEFPSGANTDNFDVDTDRHQVAAGIGIRF